MIMPKGLTRAKQIDIAKRLGVQIFMDEDLQDNEHEKDAIRDSYALLITNGDFKDTVKKEYNAIYMDVVTRYRCEMQTSQELLFLCILSQVIFNRCVYPAKNFGCTEKEIGEDSALIMGDFAEKAIYITNYSPRWDFRDNREKLVYERDDTGAGGCLRKYERYGPYALDESI
jgi:hypothetical protein